MSHGADDFIDDDADDENDVDSDDDSDSDVDADEDDPKARHVDDEGAYVCGSCGEEIVVPLDRTGGDHQSYVEDCPVCCVPNEITVDFDEDGSARVFARPE